ncbi:hypothetical protein [Flammeovirga sp. SJP92]|uniref:hypothetical protein n=1 Tax=Flammeovirga sp. SJP92 TaxID=1775430 RepID=UPI00078969EE|nr:hypothetical protein [Flammeovirga sp. SJP92]KXX66509.1 hypothetical protein AVL50_31780 [Flammeovirga sp. SJP92]
MINEQQILQDIYQSIKTLNIQLLRETLALEHEEDPFWLKRYRAIVKELEGLSNIEPDAQKVENEQFWLEVMRAFIDVVPR